MIAVPAAPCVYKTWSPVTKLWAAAVSISLARFEAAVLSVLYWVVVSSHAGQASQALVHGLSAGAAAEHVEAWQTDADASATPSSPPAATNLPVGHAAQPADAER